VSAPRAHAQRDARVIDEANTINDVPVVIDFRTDASEKVFPMVAAGASNDDIIVHPLQRGLVNESSRTVLRRGVAHARASSHPLRARREQGRVLARIAGLFARRGFNIYSLAVAPAESHARFSRVTIVVDAESAPLEQIVGQLDKLVNVVRSATSRHATPWSANCCSRRCPWTTGIVRHARHDHQSRRVDRRRQFDVGDGDAGGDPGRVRRTRTALEDFAEVELHRTGRVALLDLADRRLNYQLNEGLP